MKHPLPRTPVDVLDTVINFLSGQSPYLLLPLLPVIPWYRRKRAERKARGLEEHEKKLLADFYSLVTSMGPDELRALLYVQGQFAGQKWISFEKPANTEMVLLLLRCEMVHARHDRNDLPTCRLTPFGRRVLPETQILIRKELELHGACPAEETQ